MNKEHVKNEKDAEELEGDTELKELGEEDGLEGVENTKNPEDEDLESEDEKTEVEEGL